MRWGTCLLLLLVVVAPSAAAKPVAEVTLSGPAEFSLTGGAAETFTVHITARLTCLAGFEAPAPLRVRADQAGHAVAGGYLWRMVPDSVVVPWQAVRGATHAHEVNATVRMEAVSDVAPEEPSRENISFTVEPDRVPGAPRCGPEGYDINAQPLRVVLAVDPADQEAETSAAETLESPPVQWTPILLAAAVLAAAGAFALARDRLRRA